MAHFKKNIFLYETSICVYIQNGPPLSRSLLPSREKCDQIKHQISALKSQSRDCREILASFVCLFEAIFVTQTHLQSFPHGELT